MQKIILPIEIIELESGNYHPVVQSVFSDGSVGNWVVDTGASRTVFDLKKERYYLLLNDGSEKDTLLAGIGIGSLETKTGEIKSISFGQLKVQNLKVALLDLSYINKLYDQYTKKYAGCWAAIFCCVMAHLSILSIKN